jgi:hypothetical protein
MYCVFLRAETQQVFVTVATHYYCIYVIICSLYVEGNALFTAGKFEAAADVYRKALEHDASHSDTLTNLGR